MIEKFLAVNCPLGDKFLVDQSFPGDDMSHGGQEGHIRPNAQRQVQIGQLGQADTPGVGDNQLGPPGDGLLQASGGDRVTFGHIGADTEDDIGLFHVDQGVRHGSAANRGCQTGNRGGVSRPATVVDIVGAKPRPHEFLH